MNRSNKIKYKNDLFQDFPIRREKTFDLIVASHSLYQPIDNGFDVNKILVKNILKTNL